MSVEGKQFARAMRDHSLQVHHALAPKPRKAIVRQTSPLIVELLDARITLDSEQLLLGAWLRFYDHVFKIEVGDTLFVVPLTDGSFVALDAATDHDFQEGLAITSDPATIAGADGSIVGTVPFHDASGAVVGVALLYDKSSL